MRVVGLQIGRWGAVALSAMALSWAGCGEGGVEPAQNEGTCVGKCDSATPPPALEAISGLEVGACAFTFDQNTDPFFQLDRFGCQVDEQALPVGRLFLADIVLHGGDGMFVNNVFFRAGAAPPEQVAYRSNAYPLTVEAVLMYDRLPWQLHGFAGEAAEPRQKLVQGLLLSVPERPDTTVEPVREVALEVPFDLWPVVLWPSQELAASWGESARSLQAEFSYEVPLSPPSFAHQSETPHPSLEVGRVLMAAASRPGTLEAMPLEVLQLPTSRGGSGVNPTVQITLKGGQPVTTEITGPGYYLVGADGSAQLATPEEVLARGIRPNGGDNPPPSDMGGVVPDADMGGVVPDADMGGVVTDMGSDPDMNTPPADPCLGTCSAEQVCVAAACVERAEQRQVACHINPSKACDAGEDADCADGNVCVEGVCRQLSCQKQSACHLTPTQPCESTDHCADGNVCVEELCRLRSCQKQAACHLTPEKPCESTDHCADGNVCVEGICRQLSCQKQAACHLTAEKPCEGEEHCAEGNSCSAEKVCVKDGC